MKETDVGRDSSHVDNGGGIRGGSNDNGGRNRTTQKAPGAILSNGPDLAFDIRSVERMREAIVRADEKRNWRDYTVIGGTVLLVICILSTLVLAGATNARANRIITADIVRDREAAIRNSRVDEFIRRIDSELDEHFRRFEEHANGTTTTVAPPTTIARRTPATSPRTTATTRRPTTTTPTTIRPSTTTLAPLPPPEIPVIPPCRFALFDLCIIP